MTKNDAGVMYKSKRSKIISKQKRVSDGLAVYRVKDSLIGVYDHSWRPAACRLHYYRITKSSSFGTSIALLKVSNGPIPVPSNEAGQTISADSLTTAQILLDRESEKLAGRSPWSCRSFVNHSLGTWHEWTPYMGGLLGGFVEAMTL
jgi:hypothetical protein